MSAIAALRKGGAVDRAVNSELLVRVESDTPTVFDSWTMPFMAQQSSLVRANVLFIRLESDINSRAVKCLVSQGASALNSISDAMRLIREKDSSSREQFKAIFGFDIFNRGSRTRDIRTVRLDVSKYVFGSSPGQIRRGIRSAHSQLVFVLKQKYLTTTK